MTESQLHEYERWGRNDSRYRSLFESLPIGLYITTPDDRILDANPALIKMLGYTDKRALLGMRASELYVDPTDRDAQRARFRKGPIIRNDETQLRRHDGRLIWVRDACRAICDNSGDILYYEGSLLDITEQRRSREELLHMARHDPLTGAYNRYALTEVLAKEASRAERYQHPIGILMIDVNRFKEVNDRYGHAVGDHVLRAVSDTLRSCVRDTDYVVRYGGDEFLLLLLETNGETSIVRDRILQTLSTRQPLHPTVDFPVSVSIGIAHWMPASSQSMEAVLADADRRMYAEKRQHHAT